MYAKYWRQLRTWTYASWGVLVLGLAVALLISQFRFESISNYFTWFWFIAFGYTRLVVLHLSMPEMRKAFLCGQGARVQYIYPKMFALWVAKMGA
jgi:hypothetical protein